MAGVKTIEKSVQCPRCRKVRREQITAAWARKSSARTLGYPELACADCLNARAADRQQAAEGPSGEERPDGQAVPTAPAEGAPFHHAEPVELTPEGAAAIEVAPPPASHRPGRVEDGDARERREDFLRRQETGNARPCWALYSHFTTRLQDGRPVEVLWDPGDPAGLLLRLDGRELPRCPVRDPKEIKGIHIESYAIAVAERFALRAKREGLLCEAMGEGCG